MYYSGKGIQLLIQVGKWRCCPRFTDNYKTATILTPASHINCFTNMSISCSAWLGCVWGVYLSFVPLFSAGLYFSQICFLGYWSGSSEQGEAWFSMVVLLHGWVCLLFLCSLDFCFSFFWDWWFAICVMDPVLVHLRCMCCSFVDFVFVMMVWDDRCELCWWFCFSSLLFSSLSPSGLWVKTYHHLGYWVFLWWRGRDIWVSG